MGIKTTGTGFPELVQLSTLKQSDTFVDLSSHELFLVSNQLEETTAAGEVYVCGLSKQVGRMTFLKADTLVLPVEVHLEIRNK